MQAVRGVVSAVLDQLRRLGGIEAPVCLPAPSGRVVAIIDPEATKLALDRVGFVVRAGVQIHRQQLLWRHTRCRGIELRVPGGNAHAVSTQIAQAQNAAGIGHADEAHVFDRPVLQHLLYVPFASDR
jgi:hypothetical protein